MSLVAWSPSNCPEGHLLSISLAESEEGHDVGSRSEIEFFRYENSGKFSLTRSAKVLPVIRAVTWTKNDENVLAYGCEDGRVCFPQLKHFFESDTEEFDLYDWKAEKQHSGWVSSIDWNHFQHNLVCSGAADSPDPSASSVFIWDLNKLDTPMVPGHGSSAGSHQDSILTVSWNHQVQHILGTASTTRATIWDLRKSEPVIRLTDGLCRIKPEIISWNPDVATQLLIAAQDYTNSPPVIQLWDLKKPTAPLKSMFGHKEGVTSLSWCLHESGLMLSSGSEGTVMLWDPPNGNLLGTLMGEDKSSVPVKSVAWSPINPGVYIAARDDGILSLHSILSGSQASLGFAKTLIARERKASRRDVLDAFGELDVDPIKDKNVEEMSEIRTDVPCVIPFKPPRWMASPCCARFSFGNRLTVCSVQNGKIITTSQVVTDQVLVNRAHEIGSVLVAQPQDKRSSVSHFSSHRASICEDADIQMVWKFLEASIAGDQRGSQFVSLLGIDTKTIPEKVFAVTGRILDNIQPNLSASQATSTMSGYANNASGPASGESNGDACVESSEPFRLPESEEDHNSGESLIVEGLLTAKPEVAIDACLHAGRFTDALVLSASASQQLFSKTLNYVMRSARDPISRVVSGICLGDLESVATYLDVAQWPTCLAIILTYAMDQEYASDLADCLAERLENAQMFGPAAICHLVSTKISSFGKCIGERIVERSRYQAKNAMRDLIEQAELLLTYAGSVVPKSAQNDIELDEDSVRILAQYAKLLVEQGEMNLAFEVVKLAPNNKLALLELRHRLYHSLNLSPRTTGLPVPSIPFRKLEIKHCPSMVTITTPRSSAATEESFVGSNGMPPSFQVGGKALPPHQLPQQPETKPPPQMPNLYSPTPSHIEQINPDTSNVLAPAVMPVTSRQPFYDPTARAAPVQPVPAQQRPAPNASPFVPQQPPPTSYYQPSLPAVSQAPPPTSYYQPSLPAVSQAPPPTSYYQPSLPAVSQAPPPYATADGAPFPPQPFAPPPVSTQYPPPPLPNAAMPPATRQPSQQQPFVPPPPPVSRKSSPQPFQPAYGAAQIPTQMQPPQYSYPKQPSMSYPPPSSQPNAVAPPPMLGQQLQQLPNQTHPVPASQPSSVPPPPMPGQINQQISQTQPAPAPPPSALPSSYASRPGFAPARPPPAVTPQPYNPATSTAYAAQPQQPPNMFVPQQQTAPYNPAQQQMAAQQAQGMCTVGSAGDMQAANFDPPSFLDRRPTNSWNDPPVSMFSPTGVDVARAHQSPGAQPVAPAGHQHDRTPPQVSADLQPIVDALCELMNRCMDAAPQGTRKKLDDVDKKMPMLYERLRSKQVSQGVVTHLLQLSASVRNSDFPSAMNVIQHMASVGQFAEVGQFLLPIKLLVHTAQQLHVHM